MCSSRMTAGETWEQAAKTGFEIEDMAWLPRQEKATLLLATDAGLFQLALDGSPVELAVASSQKPAGYYCVVTTVDFRGDVFVAAAAQNTGGVYLSRDGSKSFNRIGLQGQDIRHLAVQRIGPNAWLWAGVTAPGNEDGTGCHRWYLNVAPKETSTAGWEEFSRSWQGGSCRSLAFDGETVFAASHRSGVLRLSARSREDSWIPSDINSGLPLREAERLVDPVDAVAVTPDRGSVVASDPRLVFAAGPQGVFRSRDGGESYETSSSRAFDKVTVPATWLFCSGEHEIEVVSEDEAERD